MSETVESSLDTDPMGVFLKDWFPTKNQNGEDRYQGLFVILRPDGTKIAAFPTWSVADMLAADKEELRAEFHQLADCVFDKLDSTETNEQALARLAAEYDEELAAEQK